MQVARNVHGCFCLVRTVGNMACCWVLGLMVLGLGSDGFRGADVEDAGEDAMDSSGSWSGLKAAYAQLAGVTALPAVGPTMVIG